MCLVSLPICLLLRVSVSLSLSLSSPVKQSSGNIDFSLLFSHNIPLKCCLYAVKCCRSSHLHCQPRHRSYTGHLQCGHLRPRSQGAQSSLDPTWDFWKQHFCFVIAIFFYKSRAGFGLQDQRKSKRLSFTRQSCEQVMVGTLTCSL